MSLDYKPRRNRQPSRGLRRKRKAPIMDWGRFLMIIGGALLIILGTCSVPQLLWPGAGEAETEAMAPAVEATELPQQPTVTPISAEVTAPPQPGAQLAELAAPQTAQTPPPTAELQPTAAPRPAGTYPGTATAIDSYLNDLVSKGEFSGAVLVAHENTILISQGYGMANAEQGIANTSDTRFRLASLTKPFTAVAVLMLHSRGQLNIHESICTYLPECPPAWQPITVRHLLSHTSGIPNYTDFLEFETTEMNATTPAELVMRFRDLPLGYEPGTLYYYNNSGYVLLGIIIEQVSGQPYEEFLRANIFEPLEMSETGYDHNAGTIGDGQALGYRTPGVVAPFLDTSTLHAAGSLYSTVEDMYRWDRALYTDYLIPQPLIEEMFTPVQWDYGYGWKITTRHNRRALLHPGFINGFSTRMVRYPDERVFIIVLSNLEIANTPAISNHIAQLVFEGPQP